MKSFPSLLTAIALCLSPFACTVGDDATDPIGSDHALLEEAAEVTDLALASYIECRVDHPEACADEEEDLVEALRDFEPADGDSQFRAAASASCTGKQPVHCLAPGNCAATDDVGCVCMGGGIITALKICADAADLPNGSIGGPTCENGAGCGAGSDCRCGGNICVPYDYFCP